MPHLPLPNSAPPPPTPLYILRGHPTTIHTLTFSKNNKFLLTGDSLGYITIWSLSTRRPTGVFRAHSSALLQIALWTSSEFPGARIITHARDNHLHVWKLPNGLDDTGLDRTLPIDAEAKSIPLKQPWLVASLMVNTLNFCGFARCELRHETPKGLWGPEMFVAVPAAGDSEAIDIMRLPDGARIWRSIKPPESPQSGRVSAMPDQERTVGMAMSLTMEMVGEKLVLVAGYESGDVAVYTHGLDDSEAGNRPGSEWKVLYQHKGHSQPVLGLALWTSGGMDGLMAWTTSADSLLIRHEIVENKQRAVDTRHHGQQGVVLRDDGKLAATAGWDGMVRVYAAKGGMKELAVLKWHTVGCYAVGFGSVSSEEEQGNSGKRTLVVGKRGGVSKREDERIRKEAQRHWVAAGDKDGKVSLWEIY